jgi:hypothetical protein
MSGEDVHRVTVTLDVALEAAHVYARAEREGRTVEQVLAEIAADLECRAHDGLRWRDGVTAVKVSST